MKEPTTLADVSVKHSPLPPSYVAARDALRACAKQFTPEGYGRAAIALARCLDADECEAWPNPLVALGSYARQAADNELMRLAQRVEAKRAEWKAAAA